ncbi:MAG: anion transporter, partial [Candidatus Schekmanbacteria bacterium RBG_13_48_7]
MTLIAIIIFIATYTGVAFGRIPYLSLDRTGIALLGAIAMVVTKVLSTNQAFESIDAPTIILLFSLMIISAQFRLSGFYTEIASRISRLMNKPKRFLLVMMFTSAILSAILANDIICLAFTPVLLYSIIQTGLNPFPFLIGLAVSSNIGSAATIIGNPQNMLLGQIGNLSFRDFFVWCTPPSVISLFGSYLIISLIYQKSFNKKYPVKSNGQIQSLPAFNYHQTLKGIVVTVIVIILFFLKFPREISAVALAGVLLCSRKMHTRTIMGLIDWHLIILFCSLFIVIQGLEVTQLPSLLI